MDEKVIINLVNPKKPRNALAFKIFNDWVSVFDNIGIEVREWKKSLGFGKRTKQYNFVGPDDFMIPTEDGLGVDIDQSISNVKKLGLPNVFLFDNRNNSSLEGSREVFKEINALALFKNHLPIVTNLGETGDVFYNTKYNYSNVREIKEPNILYSGWNLGYLNPDYNYFLEKFPPVRTNDVVLLIPPRENYPDAVLYDKLLECNLKIVNSLSEKHKVEVVKYSKLTEHDQLLRNTKVMLSFFDGDDLTHYDFIAVRYRMILAKYCRNDVRTFTDLYSPHETYVPINILNPEQAAYEIQEVLFDYDNSLRMGERLQEVYRYQYLLSKVIRYWVEMLKYNVIFNVKTKTHQPVLW